MSQFAACLALAATATRYGASVAKGATFTRCPTRYAYGAGAEGRRYFHPMLGRWVLTA